MHSTLSICSFRDPARAFRLRTDDLRGFRKFESVRQVMVHELAHMVFSDHDDDFKAFNSQVRPQQRGSRRGAWQHQSVAGTLSLPRLGQGAWQKVQADSVECGLWHDDFVGSVSCSDCRARSCCGRRGAFGAEGRALGALVGR